MAPHERLEAWQRAHQLVVAVYRLTGTWPDHERFGLVSQARRAAVSIPTNIAEGAAKRGPREFRRFLDTALGSLGELTYLMRLAHDLGYIDADDYSALERLRSFVGKLTWRLYQSISIASR